MIYFFSLFWFIRQTKAILFWLYLWQLKEYHVGRFIAHFSTEKGKKIFKNKLFILKLATLLILLIFYNQFVLYIILLFYLIEAFKFFYDFSTKRVKKPVLTKKTIFLLFSILLFEICYFLIHFQNKKFIFYLLVFDILTPFIVSGIVLLFQPLTVILRNRIIKKAKLKRERFKNLLTIGITGSYGKTSTKEFLYLILSEKFKVLRTKEHQNSEIGISRCILDELDDSYQVFIAEMGAYNRGGIRLLSGIVNPKIGILTGINEQHMATFGSQENIIKAKYELIESLPEQGIAIFNTNNKYCSELYEKTKINKISSKDMRVEDVSVGKEQLSFKLSSKDGDSVFFRVNLLGDQNIENIVLAVCCAKELGMSLEEIARACQKIEYSQGGMKLLRGVLNLNILDSTYSSNPDGIISHLKYLGLWQGKKAIIMPCLIELGKASKKVHRKIGLKIAQSCNLAMITTKEYFSEIKKSAIEAGMQKDSILFLENPKDIKEKVRGFSGPEDVILLEGRISKNIKELILSKK